MDLTLGCLKVGPGTNFRRFEVKTAWQFTRLQSHHTYRTQSLFPEQFTPRRCAQAERSALLLGMQSMFAVNKKHTQYQDLIL